MKNKLKKVVLAYSGGLDTSAIIPWLRENYECEVYAFVGDVGQGSDELSGIKEKAIASGAIDCVIKDLKDELVKDYISPMVKMGAVYEHGYLLGTAIARPIIAKAQAEYALSIGADALSHGCTGKGNDQVRFETVYATVAPALKVIAPWRIWEMSSREELLDYLNKLDIPCSATVEKIYSRDGNIWHLSHEGGELEDPWNKPSDKVWQMTCDPEKAPPEPDALNLKFDAGKLVAINDQSYSEFQALCILNEIGAAHGIGRIDIVENRLVGMKSRGCYETPGGTILLKAINALYELTLDRESLFFKAELAHKMARIIYDGKWYSPLCQHLVTMANEFGKQATGDVVLQLYKGQVSVLQRRSPLSLYDEEFATFGSDEVYHQRDADGFIKLYSLPEKIHYLKDKEKQK